MSLLLILDRHLGMSNGFSTPFTFPGDLVRTIRAALHKKPASDGGNWSSGRPTSGPANPTSSAAVTRDSPAERLTATTPASADTHPPPADPTSPDGRRRARSPRCPRVASFFAGNRVCQRTDGGIVAGQCGLVLPAGPRVCPGIFSGGGQDARADGSTRMRSIRHMSCPSGEYGHGCAQADDSAACPTVQDGSGTVRCSWTQLDLMGRDPEPASRWPGTLRDYGRHTDRTRYSHGGKWSNSRSVGIPMDWDRLTAKPPTPTDCGSGWATGTLAWE